MMEKLQPNESACRPKCSTRLEGKRRGLRQVCLPPAQGYANAAPRL